MNSDGVFEDEHASKRMDGIYTLYFYISPGDHQKLCCQRQKYTLLVLLAQGLCYHGFLMTVLSIGCVWSSASIITASHSGMFWTSPEHRGHSSTKYFMTEKFKPCEANSTPLGESGAEELGNMLSDGTKSQLWMRSIRLNTSSNK